jgi:hypothetical protein
LVSDAAVRLLVVAAVALIAAGVAVLARRKAIYHPPVDIAGLGLPAGLVVFTSTQCTRCKEVLAAAKSVNVPLREVTYELEPNLQERAGVVGVPLTLAIDESGNLVGQMAGVVGARSLRRAAARAGY